MSKRAFVAVGAVVLLGAAATQSPTFQTIGFSETGGSDHRASIAYHELSGTETLDFRMTTSDTVEIRLDAASVDVGPNLLEFGATIGSPTVALSSDAANRLHLAAGDSLVFEGATADASEASIAAADVTADVALQIADDAADTYYILTQPDGDVTGGFFAWPPIGGDDAVTTTTDETMLCEVIYLPQWLTVANVYLRGVVGADSASDDTISFAIYENADAGAQLTEATGADLSATANVTLDVTDVTLGPGMYRFCGCAQDVSGAAFHAATLDDETVDIMNLGAVTFGTAANVCVAGDPPATTGALTTADDNKIVFKIGG